GRRARGCVKRCRRRPTLPRSRERSTIGAVGLNDRVRNGNECGPYALVASELVQLMDEVVCSVFTHCVLCSLLEPWFLASALRACDKDFRGMHIGSSQA